MYLSQLVVVTWTVSATEERCRVEKGQEERRRATSFGLVAVCQDKALALTDLRRVFGKH